jgi:nickel/cobalt exporter
MRTKLFVMFMLIATIASAHPMGNFSINHYSAISVAEKSVQLEYIIDLAEIPTFQEMENLDKDHNRLIDENEGEQFAKAKGKEFIQNLSLYLNSSPLSLKMIRSSLTILPGAGGLPTAIIRTQYIGGWKKAVLPERNAIEFKDSNYQDRIGWKEIVIRRSQLITVSLKLAEFTDRSSELTRYPDDATISPPQETEATFNFAIPSKVIAAGEAKKDHPSNFAMDAESRLKEEDPVKSASLISATEKERVAKRSEKPVVKIPINRREDSFTRLISAKELNGEIIFFSLLVAFALGSMHALSPGHGKAIVAGYLVGSRGTAWHALFLGGVVTLTHTIGVFALGLITLVGSRYILPEDLYPWLGFVSGVSIVIIGISLFRKRLKALKAKDHHDPAHLHSHGHSHTHHHHNHESDHDHDHSHTPADPGSGMITWKSLLTVGISGGALPCPSALVVLLSAISLHRVGFGLLLILAFSLGLAVVLTSIGVLFVYASGWTSNFRVGGKLLYRMPLVSSLIISILGFAIAIQSLLKV